MPAIAIREARENNANSRAKLLRRLEIDPRLKTEVVEALKKKYDELDDELVKAAASLGLTERNVS